MTDLPTTLRATRQQARADLQAAALRRRQRDVEAHLVVDHDEVDHAAARERLVRLGHGQHRLAFRRGERGSAQPRALSARPTKSTCSAPSGSPRPQPAHHHRAAMRRCARPTTRASSSASASAPSTPITSGLSGRSNTSAGHSTKLAELVEERRLDLRARRPAPRTWLLRSARAHSSAAAARADRQRGGRAASGDSSAPSSCSSTLRANSLRAGARAELRHAPASSRFCTVSDELESAARPPAIAQVDAPCRPARSGRAARRRGAPSRRAPGAGQVERRAQHPLILGSLPGRACRPDRCCRARSRRSLRSVREAGRAAASAGSACQAPQRLDAATCCRRSCSGPCASGGDSAAQPVPVADGRR